MNTISFNPDWQDKTVALQNQSTWVELFSRVAGVKSNHQTLRCQGSWVCGGDCDVRRKEIDLGTVVSGSYI